MVENGSQVPLLGVREAQSQSTTSRTAAHETQHNQLGVFNGVLVPCLLNILGVILFLRIGWAVGQAGWVEVLIMFGVGETLALLTVLSMAAIVSNGNMRGGGSYFIISRSLGPELGGSIGLLFYAGYAVGTTFYVVGFATEIVEAFLDANNDDPANKKMYTVLIASLALAVVMGISVLGAGFFTRINGIVFAIQFGSIIVGVVSMLFRQPIEELENGGSFTGFDPKTLWANAWGDYTFDEKCGDRLCSFKIVFAILFPAMTGIMEGANLSGDLKNPNRDIGRGTIAAVFGAIMTYGFLILAFSAGFPRETLRTNMNVMENVAWPTKYAIIVGISVSAFSSALGSVFGGSRVLQALGRDGLPPYWGLSFFAKGSLQGDEPRRAVIFTWLVAQVCCFIGDLDVISPIIASFFLLSYATVNLTCFMLDVSGTPNFRPHFRYYSRVQSLSGFALCLGMLFFLDVWYAVIACGALLALYTYITYTAPLKSWGDVSQSILYHQVRKYLLKLDMEDHPKNWRPSLLLLAPAGAQVSAAFLSISNSLKKGGLFMIGDVVVGDLRADAVKTRRQAWLDRIEADKLKCIPEVTFAQTARQGYQQLVLLAGLGGMRPNCIAAEIPRDFLRLAEENFTGHDGSLSFADAAEFVGLLGDIVGEFKRNLLLAANFDASAAQGDNDDDVADETCVAPLGARSRVAGSIDLWVMGNDLALDGNLSLMMQLAHILLRERKGVRSIRVLNVVDETCDIESQQSKLRDLASSARLHKATCHAIACKGAQPLERALASQDSAFLERLHGVLESYSHSGTRVAFFGLPTPGALNIPDRSYLGGLGALVRDLPPTIFTCAGRRGNMIPQDL
ncbi:Solute carrier family 12 member 9 [Hondaea fermentalgiana]|uniref:Solute carrier family 12 member 9 n=1 Tax=Hondaea fermentalgiana TaxID=2315210 RepID=A0A2R5G8H6_9STRA|nr:Solute carrier family 12 member 9 [Hondaea fermentalgiana]|eukprot:GBG23984.1 Solute carrier family 12 member 9 [Hondaea fermentalgiana]